MKQSLVLKKAFDNYDASSLIFFFTQRSTMEEAADYKVADYLELTAPWNKNPTSYLTRYYTLFYKKVTQNPQAVDVYVRQTPSKVCVLGVASPPEGVKKVKLNTDLVGNKVKHDSVLAELLDDQDQIVAIVRAEMEGKLLELNTRLLDELDTLFKDGQHLHTGFIGIILPKVENTAIQLKEFMSDEEYQKLNQ